MKTPALFTILWNWATVRLCNCILLWYEPSWFQWELCSLSYKQTQISLASVKTCAVDNECRDYRAWSLFFSGFDDSGLRPSPWPLFSQIRMFGCASSVSFKYKSNELYENVSEWRAIVLNSKGCQETFFAFYLWILHIRKKFFMLSCSSS